MRNRKETFERLADYLPIVIEASPVISLVKEECSPLLSKEVMSEEEDDEMVRDTRVAMSFKVKRPKWRSEMVSTLRVCIKFNTKPGRPTRLFSFRL